jgi:cytochrome c-type biogenesis protein
MIDKEGNVADLYHVYQLGKGEIDGIQNAESMHRDLKSIEAGEAFGFEGIASSQGINYLGMFALGIVTSLSMLYSPSPGLVLLRYDRPQEGGVSQKDNPGIKRGLYDRHSLHLGTAAVFFIVGFFLSDIGVFIRQACFFDLG